METLLIYILLALLVIALFTGVIAYGFMAMVAKSGNHDDMHVKFMRDFLPVIKYSLYGLLVIAAIALIGGVGSLFIST